MNGQLTLKIPITWLNKFQKGFEHNLTVNLWVLPLIYCEAKIYVVGLPRSWVNYQECEHNIFLGWELDYCIVVLKTHKRGWNKHKHKHCDILLCKDQTEIGSITRCRIPEIKLYSLYSFFIELKDTYFYIWNIFIDFGLGNILYAVLA